MPGLDGTGPMGQGSQTGKRQGRCTDKADDNLRMGTKSKQRFRLRSHAADEQETFGNQGRRNERGRRLGRNN